MEKVIGPNFWCVFVTPLFRKFMEICTLLVFVAMFVGLENDVDPRHWRYWRLGDSYVKI